MADLLDIAPATQSEAVWIGDKRITVRALPPNAIASIIARFPNVRSIVGGGGDVFLSLIQFCGNAIGPIIAAGCGRLEDEVYERAATTLALEEQAKLLAAIWRVTFPNGISSFAAAMTNLVNTIVGGTGGGAKPIKIRSRNILKTSRSPSSPSAGEPASPQTMQ
jgi:hypothetical protein